MERIIKVLIGFVLLLPAPMAYSQVIGVTPTPLGMYGWDSTTNQWQARLTVST